VAGDEVYGAEPALRTECELRRIGYVFGIGCDRRIRTAAGLLRADEITAGLPKRAWQRLSAGAGAKGQRFCDWALMSHPDPAGTEDNPAGTECWWLLVRRHRHTGELAFYRCYSPEHSLQTAPDGLIALACNEIRRLFVRFVIEPSRALARPQAWSQWRRRDQHRSRTSHYHRRDDLRPST